ncbi:MAG: repeat-containing protein [Chthoniobacter sp.]|nr:repeat-containing protein [Chthoniobacter sp.]
MLVAFSSAAFAVDPPEPKFRAVTIDDKIQIGYGVAVADVDGDKLPDILLADKRQIVWYRNPGEVKQVASDVVVRMQWEKHIIAENLTPKDNVCLAAQDIDGDGKCELAIGAEWNPGDTVNSGAVFYLIAPEDRTQRWTPVKFPSVEPTTHRMRWLKLEGGKWGLVVLPLHGRGNKNGEGAPVKVLLYHPPTPLNDPAGEWKSEVINESMHMTHNLDVGGWPGFAGSSQLLLLCGREGVHEVWKRGPNWETGHHSVGRGAGGAGGVGEIRSGNTLSSRSFRATVEPMHGNMLVVSTFRQEPNAVDRNVLTDKLTEGHALACGDLLGVKSDQIVVGWRGAPGKEGSTTGVAVWTALDDKGGKWRETMIDPDGMACEDLQLADLNGDGKLDIVAAGRATRNVKIYFNETPASAR